MKIPKQKVLAHSQYYLTLQLKKNKSTQAAHSFRAPIHNSNEKPQPYKTEAATKNFSSIKLLRNHD